MVNILSSFLYIILNSFGIISSSTNLDNPILPGNIGAYLYQINIKKSSTNLDNPILPGNIGALTFI